jgi:hypothetical protein
MNFKTILLGTAALAVMAVPASAQDAPPPMKHHHHHHEMAASGASSVDARIDELERQIQELKQAEATQAAAPAPSDAVSQAQFEALQNQVYEQQAATTTMTKSSWWANTKISGRIYYDITNIDAKTSAGGGAGSVKSPQDGFNYDIKRAYFGVDHQFNDMFSANVTTDLTYDSTTKASQIFLKKAFLQAKFADALIVRIGAADMPWVPYVEGLYGYRYVENTLIDRTKFGTSTDWGAHILGTFADGLINYQVSAVNGFGYKAAPIGGGVNRSKGVDVEGRVGLNWEGFNLGVGGYTGKLGNDVQGSTTDHTATRFDAIAAYTIDTLRLGVEYFSANDWKNVTKPAGDRADGYSGFASWMFVPQWSVFGRYDWVKPTKDSNPSFKNEYYNFGVSYSPIKQLDFALVYKHDSMQNGIFSDSEFTAPVGSKSGTYNEIGLFGQVNF